MKKLFGNFKSTAGFTLIELLVVIGILGILASALVATIDPFEQLNKATDANIKNASVEFLNANIRYYTTHSAMPWFASAGGAGGADCYPSGTTLNAVKLSDLAVPPTTGCIPVLVSEGELKQGFLLFSGLTKIYVTNPNPQTSGPNDVIVCFAPVSKSGQKDPATKYDSNGVTSSTCVHTPGLVNSCYWCAQ